MTTPELKTPDLEGSFSKRLEDGEGNVVKLTEKPTVELLRSFDTLEAEVGLYELQEQWFLLVGSFNAFPIYDVPEKSEIVIHTHPGINMKDVSHCLPSPIEFIHRHPTAKRHFVASSMGVARYWPLALNLRKARDLELYQEIYRLGGQSFFPWEKEKRNNLLQEKGCQWVMHAWDEIRNQEELMKILQGS